MDALLEKNAVHARFTTQKSMDDIENIIKGFTKPEATAYIISCEKPGTSDQHYHCLIQIEDNAKCDHLRYVCKKIFTGNGEYSLKTCNKPAQLAKYVLKDNCDVRYHGFSHDLVKGLYKCSNKKGMDKFSEELQRLEETFMLTDMDIRVFCRRFILLKVAYGQNIYMSHIDAYCTKLRLKKDPRCVDGLVDQMRCINF